MTVLGTPAEEGAADPKDLAGGKIELIENQIFSDIDMALMVHPYALTLSRPIKYALDE